MCAQSSPPNFHEECRKKFLTFFHSSPLINLQYSRAGMRGKKSVLFKMTAALAAEAEGGEVGVARRNNDVSLTLWRGQNEVVRRRVVDFLEALLQQRPFLTQLPRVGVEAAEFVDKHLVFPAHFGGVHCLFNHHLSC